MRLLLLAWTFTALAASAASADGVLVASRRGGWVETFDPDTLATVSRIRVPEMSESVTADPSGRLFVAAPSRPGKPCCALFAIDPQTLQLSPLIEPAMAATLTGGRLFTQRGNTGIDVFDTGSLGRLPTIRAPGVYRLRASPDGRLLAGLANFPHPSLDLFDAAEGVRLVSQPLDADWRRAGTWLGAQYLLFEWHPGQAVLRPVDSDTAKPGAAVPLSASFPDCAEIPYDTIAVGAKLAIFAQFGLKASGRCAGPGGFVLADPVSGAVTSRFAPNLQFRQMVAGADGRYLYGLDTGQPSWQRVQIVKIDAATGQVLAARSLDPDVWYLAGAH